MVYHKGARTVAGRTSRFLWSSFTLNSFSFARLLGSIVIALSVSVGSAEELNETTLFTGDWTQMRPVSGIGDASSESIGSTISNDAPEPSSIVLLGIGALGILGYARRYGRRS